MAIHYTDDIKTKDGKFTFSDGCGTMSEQLRDDVSISNFINRDLMCNFSSFSIADSKRISQVIF
jgi:hypothetical protein